MEESVHKTINGKELEAYIYLLGLNQRSKVRKRLPAGKKFAIMPNRPKEMWSMNDVRINQKS